jgi:uncharacterized protein
VKVDYDPGKDAINQAKHGLSLADAAWFDFDVAVVQIDDRYDYGETRYRALARMGGAGYALAFTLNGNTLRPISYRRAHEKEMKRYGL